MDQAQQLRALVKMHDEKINAEPKSYTNVAKVIAITSGKGGVGKSSISINLAMQLANLGKRVIIIDADIGLANVEVMLGIKPKYDLGDLMYGEKKLSEIITEGPMGIKFISGGTGIHQLNNLSHEQVMSMTSRLYELDEMADYIIVDTGAGISDIGKQFIKSSSEVLVVVTPEPTSITDAYAVIKELNRERDNMAEGTSVKMISNRVRDEKDGEGLYERLNSVVKMYLEIKLEYLGSVVQDINISKSILSQQPISTMFPNSAAVKSIRKLAHLILNDEDKVQTKGISGIFTQLLFGSFVNKKGEVTNGVR